MIMIAMAIVYDMKVFYLDGTKHILLNYLSSESGQVDGFEPHKVLAPGSGRYLKYDQCQL